MSNKNITQGNDIEVLKPISPVVSPITIAQAKQIIEKYFKAKNKFFSSHQFIRKYKKDFESQYITQLFDKKLSRIDIQAKVNVVYSFSYTNNVITQFLKDNRNVLNIEVIQGSFTEDCDDVTGTNTLFRRTSSEPPVIKPYPSVKPPVVEK